MLITEELIRRLEESEAQRLAAIGRSSSGDVLAWCGGQAICVGSDSPWSQCVGAGLDGDVSEESFRELEEFFFSRGADVELKVSPLAHASLRRLAVRSAQRLDEFESILVREPDLPASDWPPHVEVRPVARGEEELYAMTVLRGFFGDDYPESLLHATRSSCRSMNSIGYLALFDGEPVGGATLGVASGIVSLQGASVLPDYRNKGVHKALQLARIQAARRYEPMAVTMSALPGSISQLNAQKLGFTVAYTRPAFKWSANA